MLPHFCSSALLFSPSTFRLVANYSALFSIRGLIKEFSPGWLRYKSEITQCGSCDLSYRASRPHRTRLEQLIRDYASGMQVKTSVTITSLWISTFAELHPFPRLPWVFSRDKGNPRTTKGIRSMGRQENQSGSRQKESSRLSYRLRSLFFRYLDGDPPKNSTLRKHVSKDSVQTHFRRVPPGKFPQRGFHASRARQSIIIPPYLLLQHRSGVLVQGRRNFDRISSESVKARS